MANTNLVDSRPLATICGWCPRARLKTRILTYLGYQVSHGLCSACAKKLEQEAA